METAARAETDCAHALRCVPWRRGPAHGCETLVALAIDTLAYARRLREAGFTEEQADGQAHALAAAMTDSIATKEDLQALEVRTSARLDTLEGKLQTWGMSLQATVEARNDTLEAKLQTWATSLQATFEARNDALEARLDRKLADLERRVTARTITAIAVFAAIVKLL